MKVFLLLILLLTINFSFSMSNLPKKEDISNKNIKNEQKSEPEAKLENVYFKTTSEVFLKNQPVCFYIENLSDKELVMPSAASYAIFQKDKPQTAIYTPVSMQVITFIKPKEKKQWCWNQKDFEGREVPSGDYIVRLTIFDKEGKKYFLTSSFKIKLK